MAVAAFGDEVGEFEDFVGVFAEHFFQSARLLSSIAMMKSNLSKSSERTLLLVKP